jgi:hypothetical protein
MVASWVKMYLIVDFEVRNADGVGGFRVVVHRAKNVRESARDNAAVLVVGRSSKHGERFTGTRLAVSATPSITKAAR